jgi:hypothetical protein
MCRYIGWDRG